jgi:large subunit ribosomal protein L27
MGRTRGGSGAKNGRDPNPKYLGIKKFSGETVTAGSILVKQRGTKFYPGDNVMKAGDDSLFATTDGKVTYHERMNRKLVSVTPMNE